MDLGSISKRYAKALLAYAIESEAEDIVYAEVQNLCLHLLKLPDLRDALENPVISEQEKLQLLYEASGGNVSVVFERFLRLVLQRRREHLLLFVMHSYTDLYRKKKNLYVGKLTTATAIDRKTEEYIRQQIEQNLKADIEFKSKTDPDIIGGFILQVDSFRVDASIAGQLKRIRKQFNEQNDRCVIEKNNQ